ncbi:MAG: hypothetical protein QXO30_00805 [Candidatus Caldarchaeum sp.]
MNNSVEKNILKKTIKLMEKHNEGVAKTVEDEAGRRIPAYNRVVEALGINGHNYLMREKL